MKKIHLDTDLGGDIDDLCALALLLRWPDVDITGITTVADNQGRRAGYCRYVLDLESRSDIPLKAGADIAQGYYRYEMGFPEETRYWPEPVTPVQNAPEEAIDLIEKSIKQGATIVCIGPFTNLYLLEMRLPGILLDAELFLMGGFIYPPRAGFPSWGNDMDFNIQADIRSAKHVIQNPNPMLIPLSVTIETAFRRSYLGPLRKTGALGSLIAKQAEEFALDYENELNYGTTCAGLPKDIINFQHDSLACAVALGWADGIEKKEVSLGLEEKDGWLTERVDPSGKPVKLVTKVDGTKFNELWINQVTGGSS